ncbi:CCAAT-binding transcription factor (CBF-B/NF-YA) subunit B-domain-containing protein [Glomus cerebriforme]|uniref:Transcriptional activator HAP2 n=1 Tax=Glomus cerebriforme TaxID=658196 RepID=A0A397S9J6_9GLOM|nr:CCAAT-binding transcription factor (CBF-B/NF-YA) subunit B-domain-containing protein [Glomus cerebriforme]
MIPTAEDVKPFLIKSQSFPPSPPTSPPTPHASSTPKDLKMITSVDIEDENVNLIKQEQNDGNEGEQNELPTYVNPKQYERILKRRIAREKFQKKYNISKERKPFIHQSRHNHAVRRLRGPGGRFLSASETAAAEQQQQQHQVAEMDRRQSLNSTSSSCVSPTTPVSSSTFFNVPTEYPYINSNEHYSTMSAENYLIENNDSWNSTFGTQDMCKNNNFSNMMPSGNVIESSYISNASYENFSQSPLQSVIYHLSSSITNNTQTYY